jgi:hypothetical protein
MDFISCFCASCALPCSVAFEDNSAVQDVAAEREIEVLARVRFESHGFHGGEFVDCC